MNSKIQSHPVLASLIAFVAFVDFSLLLLFILDGKNVALLNPKGFIAQEQLNLMLFTVALLLVLGVPTLTLLYFTAWKYRETNQKVIRNHKSKASKSLIITMWLIPSLFAIILASVMWPSTRNLAPQDVIAHQREPMTIQVVSMNWKWLFIYPEYGIATVNFVQIPVDRPITFEMTADESPMSSLWIPNLSGQLYTMTSHVNRLNLIAEEVGDYRGGSAEINGNGFADMKFTTRVSSQVDFNNWILSSKQSELVLDMDHYSQLLEPSHNNPMTIYSDYEYNLFEKIVSKYHRHEIHEGNEK